MTIDELGSPLYRSLLVIVPTIEGGLAATEESWNADRTRK